LADDATGADKKMAPNPEASGRGGLRRALSHRLATSGKECPDASLLAAYFDRELTSAEASRWELHFSTCARCQGQLAALARSEPCPSGRRAPAEQPAVRLPVGHRFWDLRWIAPLATAAAAAALWIALRPTLPNLEQQPARPAGGPAKPAAEKEEVMGYRVGPARPPGEPGEKKRGAPTAAARRGGLDRIAPEEKPQERAEGLVTGVAPKGADKVPGLQAQMSPESTLKAKAGPAGAVGAASGAAAAATAVPAPPSLKPPETPAERAQLARNAPASPRSALLAEHTWELRVVAPGGQVMWRFGPEGSVEHSRDAGKTWKGQFLKDTPTPLAFSAPSETVCWAVGAAGTVLRTTDGESWERAPAPTQADLIRVEARDAQHAAITARDGKTYRTNDGGRTWLVQ
jgi:hypothetical protein